MSFEEDGQDEAAQRTAPTYVTKGLSGFLKGENRDANQFLDRVVYPYEVMLSNRKLVAVLPYEDGKLIIPVLPNDNYKGSIMWTAKLAGRVIKAKEVSDYKGWLEKVEEATREATSYIQ